MNFFKIFNLKVEKPSENDKDYSNKILLWGLSHNHNDYPIRLLKALTESPTAQAVMSKRISFIRGGGFNIPDIDNIKVNKDEKLNSFHNDNSQTVGKLKGVAIHVSRNLQGEITSLTKIPFEDCRLGIPNEDDEITKIVYNPRWEQREFKFNESKYYDIYTNDVAVFQERLIKWRESKEGSKGKKYPGEIYWDCQKKDGYPYYPYPFSDYDIKAFETDSQFTSFDFNNIFNNFFLGGIINMYGDPNEKIYEPYPVTRNGITEFEDRFVGTRSEIVNKQFQDEFGGGDNAGKFMVNWIQNEGQKLDIAAFPSNTNSDLFQTTQARIWNKIALIIDVPNILANIETAGKLGANQEILNSIQLMNDSVTMQQSLLEDAYNTLLPKHVAFKGFLQGQTIAIKKKNPISFIPDKVWEVIPIDAKLKYVKENYDIDIEEPDNTLVTKI